MFNVKGDLRCLTNMFEVVIRYFNVVKLDAFNHCLRLIVLI